MVTLFVIMAGLGALSAQWHARLTLAPRGGRADEFELITDLRAYYLGHPEGRLGPAVSEGGPMHEYAREDDFYKTITAWVEAGSREDAVWRRELRPEMIRPGGRCYRCHHPDSERRDASAPRMTTYWDVRELARPSSGQSWLEITRSAHPHFMALGMLSLAMAFLVLGAPIGRRWATAIAAAPFVGFTLDIGSWYLVKLSDFFVYVILAGGILSGLGLAASFLVVLWACWLARGPKETQAS